MGTGMMDYLTEVWRGCSTLHLFKNMLCMCAYIFFGSGEIVLWKIPQETLAVTMETNSFTTEKLVYDSTVP